MADFYEARRQLSTQLFQPGMTSLIFGCGVLNLSAAAGCFIAGFMLWSRLPRAVRAAKIALLYFMCTFGPMTVLPYLAGLPHEMSRAWSLTILQTIPLAVIHPLVWFLYLSYSKRVRATYPAEFEHQVHTASVN